MEREPYGSVENGFSFKQFLGNQITIEIKIMDGFTLEVQSKPKNSELRR